MTDAITPEDLLAEYHKLHEQAQGEAGIYGYVLQRKATKKYYEMLAAFEERDGKASTDA